MSLRSRLLRSTALSTAGLLWIAAAPATAADLSPTGPDPFGTPALVAPAVSGPNFKLEPYGGWGSRNDGGGEYIYGVAGAFSMPLGQQWGLQIDGLLGQWGGNTFYGTAGHLFWRDPNVGLAGIYGSFKHLDTPTGSNIGQVAFEGEYYMSQWTARGVVGWEGLDTPSNIFTRLDLDWYATPDIALSAGYHYTGGNSALALGAEWLTQHGVGGNRLSVFGEGRIGTNHNSILAGIKLYSGQAPTLMAKHRQDDPVIDKDLMAFANLLGPEHPCPPNEHWDGELCIPNISQ